MHIKKWLFIALIIGCFLPLAGDIGIYNLQNDRLYFNTLNIEDNHSDQYHNSRLLDSENSHLISDLGFGSISFFNPHLFTSFNSAYSTGINDGALWQGKGFNGQFEGGILFNSKYFNLRLIPEIWYTQNSEFEIVPSAWNEDSDRGEYGSVIFGMDNYQRPGDEFYYEYNWGKSSAMLNYNIFELEFSTDNFILGPSRISPLIMSDNSSGFPHFRLGLNRWENFLGVFEYNAIWGFLKESDFFDDDSSNDDILLSAYNFAYTPFIIPGLTVGINRSLIAYMEDVNPGVFFKIYDPKIAGGVIGDRFGYDETDQRFSLTIEWALPASGFRIYTELAKNDYSTDYKLFLRTPEHAAAGTLGLSKSLGNFLLEFELSELINSRDYTLGGLGIGGTFYRHHIIEHGYTNRGQLMGAGVGSGSDAQTLSLSYFRDKFQLKGYLQRIGIVKDYVYGEHYYGQLEEDPEYPVDRLQYQLLVGLSCLINLGYVDLYGEVAPSVRISNNFDPDQETFNFYGAIGLSYRSP